VSSYTEEQERAHREEWRERRFSALVLLGVLVASWIAFFMPGVQEGLDAVSGGWGILLFGLVSMGLMVWARSRLRCPGCSHNVGDGLVAGQCPHCGLLLDTRAGRGH